jgi:glycosyltransferase involved in cell wall biosynthesis
MDDRRKLLFFVTEDWYFCSHRLPLAVAAKDAGYNVTVVTRVTNHGNQIESSGLKLIPLKLSRRGSNPFKEIAVIQRLIKIYHSEKPDIVHHVALKPVIYGTIASIFVSKPRVVNAMAGLGYLFSSNTLKARILRPLIKSVFRLLLNRQNSKLILQNPDDVRTMVDGQIVGKDRVTLIRGSGVDTSQFKKQPEPTGIPVVTLASRLLWDKGVGEFVRAAELLHQKKVKARFILVGKGDPDNPSAISDIQLKKWHRQGTIEWLGHKNNIAEIFSRSHIVCLPSYYGEGVPKVLIEAASCGRPIVTTNTPGCREIVKDGLNGILVPPKDADAVAEALEKLIKTPEIRKQMGDKGRELVENEFSIQKVVDETLHVYEDLLR